MWTLLSATLLGNHTVVVIFTKGSGENLESRIFKWGRNPGEGANPFKARVKIAAIEARNILNTVDAETDVTTDIQ